MPTYDVSYRASVDAILTLTAETPEQADEKAWELIWEHCEWSGLPQDETHDHFVDAFEIDLLECNEKSEVNK